MPCLWRFQLCGSNRLPPVAAAAAAAAAARDRHFCPAAAATIRMQQAAISHIQTILYAVGFADVAAEVLPLHTGWHRLQDKFQLINLPVATQPGQQVAALHSTVKEESTAHPNATEDAAMRWEAFQAGANMVTHCGSALAEALLTVSQQQQQQQQQQVDQDAQQAAAAAGCSCVCDWCGLPGLSAAGYWSHHQLYHINHANKQGSCQVCGKYSHSLARHLHDSHDPTGKPPEQRTGVFARVIVRRPSDGKFLMTQEFAGSDFWVPGGGVEPGESLVDGAVRECREEAGVEVAIKGILDLESHHGGAWRRVMFLAEPAAAAAGASTGIDMSSSSRELSLGSLAEGCPPQQQQQQGLDPRDSIKWRSRQRPGLFPCCSPKTLPDWESAGACWVAAHELSHLPLRSAAEPCRWFPLLAGGVQGLKGQLPLIDSLELPREWAEGVFEGFPCQHSSSSS